MDQTKETSPDDLMDTFRGRSLKSIIIFTVVVHLVIILAGSVPFFLRAMSAGSDELSEDDRMQLAVKDATAALREIADKHGVTREDLSERIAGGNRPARAIEEDTSPVDDDPVVTGTEDDDTGESKSAIEEELEVATPGPEVPPVDEEVNLFE